MNLRTLLHAALHEAGVEHPTAGTGSAESVPVDRAADGSRSEELGEYLEAQIRRLRIPGASLAVIEGDRIVPARGYGLAAGLLLTASNILLLESLTHIDTSLGSTIYRLNTIGVVVLSVLFLSETIGLYKGLGVAAGIGAVLLLYRPGVHGEGVPRRFAFFFALAVTASACRATYGVVTKGGLSGGARCFCPVFWGWSRSRHGRWRRPLWRCVRSCCCRPFEIAAGHTLLPSPRECSRHGSSSSSRVAMFDRFSVKGGCGATLGGCEHHRGFRRGPLATLPTRSLTL